MEMDVMLLEKQNDLVRGQAKKKKLAKKIH